jgi:uncharacterized protein involved in exopolysaccharide biosynthesis
MAIQSLDQVARGPDTTTVKDALDFLSRRVWLFVLIAAAISMATIVLAFRWPPLYLSQSTILIEQPAIPEDLVPTTIRNYVDEQIQIVAQRINKQDSVLAMIEKLDLYPEERKTETPSETVGRFIEAEYLENLTAEVTDDRGRAADTTFAFYVGFHHSDPVTAQKVTAELAQRFLDENLQSRMERASTTTSFLEDEADRLAKEIADMEKRLADFKHEYGDAMPGQLNLNVDVLNRTETELNKTEQDLRDLRAQQQIIQSEMSSLDPYATIFSESGEPIYSAQQRLAELRQQYLQLSSRYGPEHPDVVRTKREIEGIVGSGNVMGTPTDIAQQRATLEAERDSLLERYSPEHPDVVRLQKTIDSLPAGAAAAQRSTPATPNNPAYLAARAKLQAVQSGIAAAEARRIELIDRRSKLEKSIAVAPRVEQEWLQLSRGYESAKVEYDEIRRRGTGARLSENLEVQNKGERFTLIKRADLPTIPVEPNRPAIIILGLVLALGAGIGVAALVDALDSTIRSPQDLQAVFALKPIGTIPYVNTAHDRRIAWTRRVAATGAAIACLVLVAALV